MNGKQTVKIWSRVLCDALAGKTAAEQKAVVVRLEKILENKKKSYLLPKIIELALALGTRQRKLEITFAHSQPAEIVEKLKKNLGKKFEGWAEIETKIDPKIIGGFVVQTEQCILNASIKNQLEQLRKSYE